MNKLTKGAIAGAAGIVLLMGGAGSLAYWTGTADLGNAQTITAGQLKAAAGTTGTWLVNNAAVPAAYKIVPGDQLTYSQNVTVDASGSNLKFQVSLANGAITADTANANSTASSNLVGRLQKAAAFTVSGSNVTLVSGTTDTYKVATAGSTTVAVSVTITWTNSFNDALTSANVTADNNAQLGGVKLANYALNVTQVA
ncbi:hypothetical protein GCM10027515_31590 [Schumannella luteola]|uniref:Alternate signal-mediated exported protein n=1 Tax=Schumannella luteola TaxID=472059 RepID=A0A852YCI6_9MICO|nr:alternate-type signal peptide domain-containing protein [Schumannella luteola]NYG99040.1 alternate signal-mediated exported protein [Schumannella luteola]